MSIPPAGEPVSLALFPASCETEPVGNVVTDDIPEFRNDR